MIRKAIGISILGILIYWLVPSDKLLIQDLWLADGDGISIDGVDYTQLCFEEGRFGFSSGHYQSMNGTYELNKDEIILYVSQIDDDSEANEVYSFPIKIGIKKLVLSSEIDISSFKPFEYNPSANTVGSERLAPSYE